MAYEENTAPQEPQDPMGDRHRYGQKVEQWLAKWCIAEEQAVAKANLEREAKDFESMIDLLECERTEGDYEWESDIFLPEYPAMWLTQMSLYGSQYFQTREFVDVYLEDGSPDSRAKANAAKECINRTLNQRHLHHFQKYIRGKGIRDIHRNVVYRCWWERKDREVVAGFKNKVVKDEENDVYGRPITDPEMQIPGTREVAEPIKETEPIFDRFNYDVVDPRNVFTSDEYVYSLQDKQFVYIRYESSLQELRANEEDYGYINLDILEGIDTPRETETSKETYNKDVQATKVNAKPNGKYDIIEGYKKDWVVVTRRDDMTGEPMEAEPGYDEYGKKREGAEYQEIIIGFAVSDSSTLLIRFQLTPFVDADGDTYRPLVRDICYIHPTKDGGMGDGKIARETQVAINDTFNISNDRVRLATIPTLKVSKYDAEDNDTIWIGPGHKMELSDVKNVEEMKVSDDIEGGLRQIAMLRDGMQRALAIFPSTQGDLPDSPQTATAVAGGEQKATMRTTFKSLTSEYTGLTELYWMILQMTWKFAHPQTGTKLMGDKVYDFDPRGDYFYKPLTQSIETETSRATKRRELATIFGYVAQIPNPNTPKVLNMLLARFLETFGDEYEEIRKTQFDETAPMVPPTGGGQSPNPVAAPASNQNAVEQSAMEQNARGMMGE